jgi:aspartate kinase
VIHPNSDLDASDSDTVTVSEPASLAMLNELSLVDHGHKKFPTAVTIKENIVVLNVNSNKKSVSHGFLARIFETLDRYGIVVDLISTSEVHVSMAVEDTWNKKVMDRVLKDLDKSGTVSGWNIYFSVILSNFRHTRSLFTEEWPSFLWLAN